MSNMIKSHNKKVIKNDVKEWKSCNCKVKSERPLNGQYQFTDIIYKCTLLSRDKPKKCTSEMLRLSSKRDFMIIGSRLTMKLVPKIPPFQNIWELKETSNLGPALVWSIAKKVTPYSNISK